MFFVSPLGIQADGISTEGQGDDMSFDAVWQSRGRLTGFGYVVSIAVPFKSLRFPPGSALVLARSLGALMFEVSPRNPATFAAVIGVLLTTALTATWLPARRATRIDPTVALRADA